MRQAALAVATDHNSHFCIVQMMVPNRHKWGWYNRQCRSFLMFPGYAVCYTIYNISVPATLDLLTSFYLCTNDKTWKCQHTSITKKYLWRMLGVGVMRDAHPLDSFLQAVKTKFHSLALLGGLPFKFINEITPIQWLITRSWTQNF